MTVASPTTPNDSKVAERTHQISQAFVERGDEYMETGEFHLAIRDYAQATIHRVDRSPESQYYWEVYGKRQQAMWSLGSVFSGNLDVKNTRIPTGHLVVGDGNILLAMPLTPEGRQQAIECADELARNARLRHKFDDEYLTESDEFDAIVYRNDGKEIEEIHRAEPIRDDETEAA